VHVVLFNGESCHHQLSIEAVWVWLGVLAYFALSTTTIFAKNTLVIHHFQSLSAILDFGRK